MNVLVSWMERVGGFLLFVIMILIALSSVTRYLFNWPIPDADSISRLLLGTVVFWGLASCCRHNEHIRVDLLWEHVRPRVQAAIDLFASGFTLVALAALTVSTYFKVVEYVGSHEVTYDLQLPVWPLYVVAWLGLAATVVVLFWMLVARGSRQP